LATTGLNTQVATLSDGKWVAWVSKESKPCGKFNDISSDYEKTFVDEILPEDEEFIAPNTRDIYGTRLGDVDSTIVDGGYKGIE